MENLIGLKELRQNLQEYASQVAKGRSFVVLRRSKPLFKITPIEEAGWESVIDFTKIRRGGIEIKELISRL